MAECAVRIEHLSKRYTIGRLRRPDTLRDRIAEAVSSPLRRLRSFGRSSDRQEDAIWALRDVSLTVAPGEVLGIIGRNGAGKSTLLKILSRITDPTEGRAVLHGRVGSLLEVGTGFHLELTGRENIYLSGAVLGMTRREIAAQFDEIVAFSGVEAFIDTPVKRYSSGMRVRLGFAVAAHLQPEILLIDEVLAVGDAAFQQKCLGKMDDAARSGRTVFFVSHNTLAIRRLCRRVIWLDQGAIAAEGSPGEIVEKYLSPEAMPEERAWDNPEEAPGDEAIRLAAVRVRDPAGRPASRLTLDQPVCIETDLWSLKPDVPYEVSLSLFNQEGVRVLSTGTAVQTDLPRIGKAGRHRASCTLPGGLLNSGLYTVALIVLREAAQPVVKVPDALCFCMEEDPETRQACFGEWLGVVRVGVPWRLDFVGAS